MTCELYNQKKLSVTPSSEEDKEHQDHLRRNESAREETLKDKMDAQSVHLVCVLPSILRL